MTIVPPPWVAELAGQHWKPAGLAVTVLLLAWLIRRAVKSGQPDRWLAAVALLVGLAWSGEAMWEVATQKLHVGTGFAVAAFAVFEVQLATAMMRAERHRGDRRRRDRHIRAAWRVAMVMGCVVVWAADSPVEVALRPAIPLLLVSQWKVGLTDEDDGTGPVESSSWIWTPQKVGVALGLLKPGDESLSQAQVRQQIDRMVKAADTIALAANGGVRDKAAAKARLRLRTLARTATEQMVAEVARRQRQAALAETLMVNADRQRVRIDSVPAETLELTALIREQARTARQRISVPEWPGIPAVPLSNHTGHHRGRPETGDPASQAEVHAAEGTPASAPRAEGTTAEASAPAFRPEPTEAEDHRLPPVDLPPSNSAPVTQALSAPPAEGRAPSAPHGRKAEGVAADRWRRKYEDLIRDQPNITRKEAAALLGTTDRTLRAALNGSANRPDA